MFLKSSSLYPKSHETNLLLYGFQKVKDVSHRKEVKEIMSLKQSLSELCDRAISEQNKKYVSIDSDKEMKLNPAYLRKLCQNVDYNSYEDDCYSIQCELLPKEQIFDKAIFSIVGGYVRNELFGTDFKTDIDIAADGSQYGCSIFDILFKRTSSLGDISMYDYNGTNLHVISNPLLILKDRKEGRYSFLKEGNSYNKRIFKLEHVFIDPSSFDFTVNCGNISSVDGCLYAPPATIYDIEHKILRPTCQIAGDEQVSLLRQSIIIRGIRFALKYDMQMHDSLYMAIKAYTSLQKERKSIDDTQMFNALKHLMDDPKPLRDEIYSTLRRLGTYETENYPTFEEYFDYIKNNHLTGDYSRVNKINVEYDRMPSY